MAPGARLDARSGPAKISRDPSCARGDGDDQGYQARQHPRSGTQRWIELRIPGADTRLVLFTPDGHENRIGTDQNVVFWTDDVEKTWKTLSAKGVTFTGPPKKEPWGTFAIFEDPDGNRFVIGTK